MTVRDFYNHIKNIDPDAFEWDNELVVQLDYPSLGPTKVEPIVGIFTGFDWESGKTFLLTKNRLVRSFKTRDIEQVTLETIELRNLENKQNPKNEIS